MGDGAAGDRLDRSLAALRAAGLRRTGPRVAVLGALSAHEGHATADEVHARVTSVHPDVAVSTVYRALEALCRLDLVQHVHVADGGVRYHLSDRVTGASAHAHVQCSRCGTVNDLPLDVLAHVRDRLAAEQGFALDAGHVALSGVCAACRAA